MEAEEKTGVDTELGKIRTLVEAVMKRHPETRNSDYLLLYWCWVQAKPSFKKVFTEEEFCQLPHFESVRRLRARIQNVENLLLPTDPKVAKKRRIREEEFRRYFGRGYD